MQFKISFQANIIFLMLATVLFTACSTSKNVLFNQSIKVKNYPTNKPFVYSNKIVVTGNISTEEKQQLTTELGNYWDDSMKVRIIKPSFLKAKYIDKPAAYDTANLARSKRFMENYLKSKGYYYATFTDTIYTHTLKDQQRVMPLITIKLGKNITLDTVAFELNDSNLQRIAVANANASFLKIGEPYTKQVISSEIDRLTNIFNKNGYYNFKRDDLYALVDTTDKKFLNLTLDPFELAKLLDEYAKSKLENPKWRVTIKQREDTTGLANKRYYFGTTYFYTQAGAFDVIDSVITKFWLHDHSYSNNYALRFNKKIIRISILRSFTSIKRGQPYSNIDLFNTITALSKLGPWKQIDAKLVERDSDTLDVHIAMVPDKKYTLENTAEISKNNGDLTAGDLLGLSLGVTLRNRNVWKQAIQAATTLRTGLELNLNDSSNSVQTIFANLGHTYSFPKMIGEKPIKSVINIIPIKFIKNGLSDLVNNSEKRTSFSVNAGYTDRLNLFRLRNLNTIYSYEFRKNDKLWTYSPINVELYGLDELPGLTSLINQNPFLRLSFNTGNVIGQTFNFYQTYINKKNSNRAHYFRYGIEESGLFSGMIKSLQNNIYRYGKVEVEYRENTKSLKHKSNEFAYRLFGGVGFNYSNNNSLGVVLPFFKQFFVGGPNSMRAWGLRQLGQGSSMLYDTSSSSFKDRFGDIRIEGNFEYRFTLYTTSVVKFNSVLFADVGNVWNLKNNSSNPNAEFTINRFYKDIAIAVGTGLRLDFGIFLIRIDAGYKLKDPAREYNNGWINLKNASLSEMRSNGTTVKNFAFQLGIGLPF